jgi:hypothetical protein
MRARRSVARAAVVRATDREVGVVAAVLHAGSEKAAALRLGLSHWPGVDGRRIRAHCCRTSRSRRRPSRLACTSGGRANRLGDALLPQPAQGDCGRFVVIIRVFRARIRPGFDEEFEALVKGVSIPLVAAQDGLIACYVGRPIGRNHDFAMVSSGET